jgi:hypothetical protein
MANPSRSTQKGKQGSIALPEVRADVGDRSRVGEHLVMLCIRHFEVELDWLQSLRAAVAAGNQEICRGGAASTESSQSNARWLNSDRAPASQCAPAPSLAVKTRRAFSHVKSSYSF